MTTVPIDRALRRGIPQAQRKRMHRVAAIAARHGCRAWLVGGPVRDLLLGRVINDLDLAIDGNVRRIADRVAREFGGSVRWHARFQTAVVLLQDAHLDLARTRTETYAAPAALPRVRPGTIEDDLARRDFAINALAVEIRSRGHGALLDPFGGRSDLRAGRMRILHDGSFTDDPTRAFRAARFAARFGFRLDRRTRARLRDSLGRGDHLRLGGQRVAAEMRRVLSEARPATALAFLARWGLSDSWGAPRTPTSAGLSKLRRAPARLDKWGIETGQKVRLALGCAFHDLASSQRERIAERLRLTRPERRTLVQSAPSARALLKRLQRASGSARRESLCCDADPEVLVFSALLADAALFDKLRRWRMREVRHALLVDGHDLRAAGVPQGPLVARALQAAKRAAISGAATSRAQQLRAALRAAGKT